MMNLDARLSMDGKVVQWCCGKKYPAKARLRCLASEVVCNFFGMSEV